MNYIHPSSSTLFHLPQPSFLGEYLVAIEDQQVNSTNLNDLLKSVQNNIKVDVMIVIHPFIHQSYITHPSINHHNILSTYPSLLSILLHSSICPITIHRSLQLIQTIPSLQQTPFKQPLTTILSPPSLTTHPPTYTHHTSTTIITR